MKKPHEVRILVTRDFPPVGLEMLKAEGFLLTECKVDRSMLPAELIENAQNHDVLFCASSDKLDANFFETCGHLEMISQFSAGYDNIDLAAAKVANIPIGHAPGAMKNATADVAFGLMIASSRKMFYMHKKIERGQWGKSSPRANLGQELNGKTLGIFGMGKIGMEMAKKCVGAYDMKIIYCSNHSNKAAEDQFGAVKVDFETLLAQSDVLTVHSALTDETKGKFNSEAFQKLKQTAIFINTARGPIHNETDLMTALEKGWIWGAGLDVTDPEPMNPNNPLLQMENVCVLPHIGSATVEARDRMSEYAAQNIIEYFRGNTIPYQLSL